MRPRRRTQEQSAGRIRRYLCVNTIFKKLVKFAEKYGPCVLFCMHAGVISLYLCLVKTHASHRMRNHAHVIFFFFFFPPSCHNTL